MTSTFGSKWILTVGSISEDIFAFTDRFPEPGETLIGTESSFRLGGKGANQAVAAAKSGILSGMLGAVGADDQGDHLLEQLGAYGVDVSGVLRVSGVRSGAAHIVVENSGENCIIAVPGANGTLSPEDLQPFRSIIRGAAVVVAQAEIPAETISELINLCAEEGTVSILNIAPFMELPPQTITAATWVVVNEVEFSELLRVDRPTSVEQVCELLASAADVPEQTVVTLGAWGAVLAIKGEPGIHVPASEAEEVIDTTGAGDAFVGVFAAGLANGLKPLQAVRWACQAGAAAVQKRGAASSYPDFTALVEGFKDD